MAEYSNRLFEKYIPNKDLEERLLFDHPVPSNLNKVKQLDDFVKSSFQQPYLREYWYLHGTISTNILEVMGPLSRLWQGLEDVKVKVPVENLL